MKEAAASEVPARARWNRVTETADALSDIYSVAPIPVEEIAERNGVEVVLADFGRNRDRVAGICDSGGRRSS